MAYGASDPKGTQRPQNTWSKAGSIWTRGSSDPPAQEKCRPPIPGPCCVGFHARALPRCIRTLAAHGLEGAEYSAHGLMWRTHHRGISARMRSTSQQEVQSPGTNPAMRAKPSTQGRVTACAAVARGLRHIPSAATRARKRGIKIRLRCLLR